MKRYSFATAALMLLSGLLIRADEPKGAEQAKFEVERRGHTVQIVDDEIRDMGQEAYFAALSIPADDSHKWFLTVVYDKQNAQTDALKRDLLTAKELAPWVQIKDRSKKTYDVYSTDESFMHVNFESRNNPFKPEKWKHIKAEHCPLVMIQLPISGEWGKAGTVVNQRVGYSGKPDELAEWIRASVEKYTLEYSGTRAFREAMAKQRIKLGHAGHRQIGAYTAPFPVEPKELGHGIDPPMPFPDMVPTKPEQLSLDEIRKLVPSAPLEFAVAQFDAKAKSAAEVQAAWAVKQQQQVLAEQMAALEKLRKELEDAKKKPVVETPPEVKPIPVVRVDEEKPVPVQERPILSWLLGSGVLLLVLNLAVNAFAAYAKATPSLTDDMIAGIVVEAMKKFAPPVQQLPKE